MSNEAKPKRKLNRLHVILIALALMSVLVTGVTFSSYKSTSEGGDSVQVALFSEDYSFDIPVNENYYPGCEEKQVEITIMNYEGEKVSEVSQHYTVSAVVLNGRVPLDISFDEGEVDVPAEGDFLVSGGKQTATHIMKINWPIENNDYRYADEIDIIRVTVSQEQIN